MSTPFEQYRPFKYLKNTIPVPITVPEDPSLWTVCIDLQEQGLPNGLYILDANITFTPSSNSKSTLFRGVIDGVADTPVSIEAKDATDRLTQFFQKAIVVTDGTINAVLEAQVEAGQGSQGIVIDQTSISYERKLESTDPI